MTCSPRGLSPRRSGGDGMEASRNCRIVGLHCLAPCYRTAALQPAFQSRLSGWMDGQTIFVGSLDPSTDGASVVRSRSIVTDGGPLPPPSSIGDGQRLGTARNKASAGETRPGARPRSHDSRSHGRAPFRFGRLPRGRCGRCMDELAASQTGASLGVGAESLGKTKRFHNEIPQGSQNRREKARPLFRDSSS